MTSPSSNLKSFVLANTITDDKTGGSYRILPSLNASLLYGFNLGNGLIESMNGTIMVDSSKVAMIDSQTGKINAELIPGDIIASNPGIERIVDDDARQELTPTDGTLYFVESTKIIWYFYNNKWYYVSGMASGGVTQTISVNVDTSKNEITANLRISNSNLSGLFSSDNTGLKFNVSALGLSNFAENNRNSTYTYKQVFLNENEDLANDSSSSESDSLDNDSSSSAIDGWIGKQPDYYVGVIKMGRITRLKKDDDNESSITTRTKIKTAGRLGGATVVIGGYVISFQSRYGGGGGEVQREFKYRKVDGTEQLYKFQVSGKGLIDFLNLGSDNPDLVYPLVVKKDMNGNNVDDKEYHLQLPLTSDYSKFLYPFMGKYNGLYIYNTDPKTCGTSVIEEDEINNKVWEYCVPNENDTETEYELQKIYDAKKVSETEKNSDSSHNTVIQKNEVNSFTYETGEFISL